MRGSRRILGPYLAALQASGAVVGVVTRFDELLGYGLRLVSGRLTDATRQYWPITIFGYVAQIGFCTRPRFGRQLARGSGFDHSRAGWQRDPQSAARRDALACREADRRLWLGVWPPRGCGMLTHDPLPKADIQYNAFPGIIARTPPLGLATSPTRRGIRWT